MMAQSTTRQSTDVLHLMVLDKFIPAFIDFVGREVTVGRHRFCLIGEKRLAYGLTDDHEVEWVSTHPDLLQLVQTMHEARMIVLHGLWSDEINRILYAFPALRRKCQWVIWGGDLYINLPATPDRQWECREAIRQEIISTLGGVVGLKGDAEHARQVYGFNGRFTPSFVYPSNLAPSHAAQPRSSGRIKVLVGNSSTPSNCHLEAFELIDRALTADDDVEIHCPLSYGDADYRQLVIANGRARFGTRFHPMVDLMPLTDYLSFLSEIDIAMLNHNRQQAMGNAVNLLGMGKKVYMRAEQSHTRHLNGIGVATYLPRDFRPTRLDPRMQDHNIGVIQAHFSTANLARQLNQLFSA
jgi:dTDP-N-acetylfucosamine:lipid II N-acetylfucosaminyltransferase